MAEVLAHLALVEVADAGIGQDVFGEPVRVVAVVRRRAGAGVTRHAEAVGLPDELAGDGVERQLHRCRVAAGDRDALGVDQMRAVRLGQAVRPVVVESMIGAEVDDDAWG